MIYRRVEKDWSEGEFATESNVLSGVFLDRRCEWDDLSK